eukprot:6522647-Heterocapsa_arctica.AAC.1
MHWHLRRKPTTKCVKVRIIVRQVRHGSDDLDTFAATATTCGATTLLALLAEKNREGGGRWMA